MKADGVGTLITDVEFKDLAGKDMFRPKRDFMTIDRVRFVGEIVAVVLADTQAQAKAAAELVMVDYDGLPAVGSTAFAASSSPSSRPASRARATISSIPANSTSSGSVIPASVIFPSFSLDSVLH